MFILSLTILLFSQIITAESALHKIITFKVQNQKKDCENQFELFVKSLKNGENWANEMFSAYANFDKFYTYGNSYDLGDFDACIELKHISNAELITGKHCLIQYYYEQNNIISVPPVVSAYISGWKNMNKRLAGAVCIPSSCSSEMIPSLMRHIFNETDKILAEDYNQEDYCQVQKIKKFKAIDYFSISMIASLCFLMISSTVYDCYCRQNKITPNELFISFSVYTNTKKLFDVNRNQSSLGHLSGIKVLSCFGTLLLHSVIFRLHFPNDPRSAHSIVQSLLDSFLQGFLFNVDTFLLISGMLMTRSVLKEFENGSFNIVKFYFHRYMRITPVLGILILAQMLQVDLHKPAPFMFSNDFTARFESQWWAQLLHIQNYYDYNRPFIPIAWYLSVDFQLTLLTPLIVYAIWKWNWSPVITCSVLIGILQYFINLEVAKIEDFLKAFNLGSDFLGVYAQLYHQTHFRATPWIVGIFLGHFIFKHEKFQINKAFSMLLWIFSSVIFGKSFFPHFFHFVDFHSLYLANNRLMWAVAMGWIIFACHYGYCDILNNFLSRSFWIPVEKIGYSIYMLHTLFILRIVQIRTKPTDFDFDSILSNFCSDCVLSCCGAFICYLLVEQPLILVAKHLTRDWRPKIMKTN